MLQTEVLDFTKVISIQKDTKFHAILSNSY